MPELSKPLVSSVFRNNEPSFDLEIYRIEWDYRLSKTTTLSKYILILEQLSVALRYVRVTWETASTNSGGFNATEDPIIKSVYACNCEEHRRRPRKFLKPPKFIRLSYLEENCTQMDGLIPEP